MNVLKLFFLILMLAIQNACVAQTSNNVFYEDCNSNIELCIKALEQLPSLKGELVKSLEEVGIQKSLLESFFFELSKENSKKIFHQLNKKFGESGELRALFLDKRLKILEYIFLYQQLDLVIKRTSIEEVLAFIYDIGFETEYYLKSIESRGLDINTLKGIDVATTLSYNELDKGFNFIYQRLVTINDLEKYELLIKLNHFQQNN